MTGRIIVRFVENIPTLAGQITAKISVLRQSEVTQEPEQDRHSSTLFISTRLCLRIYTAADSR